MITILSLSEGCSGRPRSSEPGKRNTYGDLYAAERRFVCARERPPKWRTKRPLPDSEPFLSRLFYRNHT